MPNLNSILGLSLVAVNVAQNQTTVNISLQGITLPTTECFYNQFMQVLTTGSTVTLPTGKAFAIYVRNLGANPITVVYTPTGGSPATAVITPVTGMPGFGGVFMLFETVETSGGITSLTLSAAVATTPAEVYVAW
jgi:hypothetical protein